MEKKAYVSPAVEMMEMEAQSMMAQSVTSNLDGLNKFGGNASANSSIMEADGNKNNGWDLW